jgi:hypothetical protein
MDFEVFKNWWCVVYCNADKTDMVVIRSDDLKYYDKILKMIYGSCLFGFNSKRYDNRILNAIISKCDARTVHAVSQAIIDDDESNPFNNYRYWNKFAFSDLYDDWRFGSLKEFESNTGMPIEECSVSFEKEHLTEEDKQEIIKYCIHDVMATCNLYDFRQSYIRSKLVLSDMFNIPLQTALKSTNAKLAAIVMGAVKENRYYDKKFTTPEKVKGYLEKNIPFDILEMFEYFTEDNKEAILFENKIVFGIGGIHSVCSDMIFVQEDSDNLLINIDVTSYYPNLMILFGYISRNVENPTLIKDLYDLRVELKRQSKEEEKLNGKSEKFYLLDSRQDALKLILNTMYGAMKKEYIALYDPSQASSLCYLGQLLLCGLANEIHTKLGAKIIQTNTDGILIKVSRKKESLLKEIVSNWEKMTGFTMEFDNILYFYQRDVNNYIEVTSKTKEPLKLKGKWTNQAIPGRGMPNLNAPITHKAILEYYINNTPIDTTINSCNDIVEFCFTAKTGHNYSKTYHYIKDEPRVANKVNRVVATTDKTYGTLKKYKKTEEGVDRLDKIAEIPENCFLMNGSLDMISHLDKNWYIEFAKGKIKELVRV